MEEPNYILKCNNKSIKETNYHPLLRFARICNWLAFFAYCVYQGIYQVFVNGASFKSLFTANGYFFFVFLIMAYFLRQKLMFFPTPVEIQFYKDYILFYKEKEYVSRTLVRCVYNKMKYEDIKACKWSPKSDKLSFDAWEEYKVYDYNQDGTLQPLPSRDKFLDAGVVLRTRFSREINFKKEIEAHSPIKVQMTDY